MHSVYRDALDTGAGRVRLDGLTDAEREELTLAWQRLRPWPDVVPGLTRLKAALHPGHPVERRRLRGGQHLQAGRVCPGTPIFAAEMAGVFKPDPAIYRMAATYLGLDPAEIMMVASHKYDIRAAGGLGFRTAFVARPLEFGADGEADVAYSDEFDINASDFLDLADQLGC